MKERTKIPKSGHDPIRQISIAEIRPSPENEQLYRPVCEDDPEIIALSESIAEHGVVEPLVITLDGFILSGHRRYVAAKLAGLHSVPCRAEQFRRSDDPNRFLRLLREYNRQREKSFDEKVRETVVTLNPEDVYSSLVEERKLRSVVKVAQIELREIRVRASITDAKKPFLDAILKILSEFRNYWPVSERLIHYHLLDDPPLRHASKPGSIYRNDKDSSKSLSELVTRARIVGLIPEEAIEDPTRPSTVFDCYRDPQTFIAEQLGGFLKGYWRDLMQSQANHLELYVEKRAAFKIVEPVAAEFCIPLTAGGGYSSHPPLIQIKNRFRKSGKEKLVLIILSDFDPDGEEIAHSFARNLRDDYRIRNVVPVRAGLRLDQVQKLKLHSSLDAKETSANYDRFVNKYGEDQNVFELEAVSPAVLQKITREAIDAVIDRELFNRELAQEKLDSLQIEGLRRSVAKMLEQSNLTA